MPTLKLYFPTLSLPDSVDPLSHSVPLAPYNLLKSLSQSIKPFSLYVYFRIPNTEAQCLAQNRYSLGVLKEKIHG